MTEREEESDKNENLEKAVFGREVELFLNEDPIGKYLAEKARQQLEEAQAQLVDINPSATSSIIQLQIKAQVANRIAGWLGEAVIEGRNSARLMQQEKDVYGG